MNIQDLKRLLVVDEAGCWSRIEELRWADIPDLLASVDVRSNDQAIGRGVETVRRILEQSVVRGLDFESFEPGHGSGHLARDYVNALRLLTKLDADPSDVFVGFVAGVLHDFSCGLIERYAEAGRAVRHAEAGAIFMMELAKDGVLGLNDAEIRLIAYAIAAHTHYRREEVVRCKDGIERNVRPYQDVYPDGNPYLCVWIPRWIDRLDCSGPTLVARHFLTLRDEHQDYGHDEGHFQIKFQDHLRPVLRTVDEIKAARGEQTMLEHIRMFALSQNNDSPYGKFDRGRMVSLRDVERDMLFRIIEAARNPRLFRDKEETLRAWERFLGKNIEPTAMGARFARELCAMFRDLDEPTQIAWCNGFEETMRQYGVLSSQVIEDLDGMPREFLSLPSIVGDLRIFIKPTF